ncbi:MAG TPA: hypothetical protein VFQ50_10770 [Flavobacterium sp.]|jgi:hypothetical protein|nr:hypothetical protein [Flavobacterium sp.]
MKTLPLWLILLAAVPAFAQGHFSGITTSQRVGLMNASINPAELTNLTSKYEIQVVGASMLVSNNKIGFSDLTGGEDFEDLIFRGDEAVNMRIDGAVVLPGFAMRHGKWSFGLATKAYAKMDLVDVDANIGDAISNNGINIFGSTTISSNENQRISGTSWGEVGLLAARNLFEDEKHRISGGVTLKLLFPGSYTNFGADSFTGTINSTLSEVTLTDAQANLNIAYSGNLGESFTEFGDYTRSLFGKLNGVAADLGINYQLKGTDNKYRVNAGLSIRNIGSMTFKDNNNASTDYVLSIQGFESLNLEVFENADSMQDVEQILLNSGYLDKTERTSTDFKVELPTTLTAYADVKIAPTFYVTVFTNQKLKEDSGNDQITGQNVFSVTPRYTLENFEVWSAWSANEFSGLAGGIGLRAYGFYLGSGSIITALISDAKEADVFVGYSFGLE